MMKEEEAEDIYHDPVYKAQRTRFLDGMRVYASGEARVHDTARAFIAATNDEEDDNISVKLISDDDILKFLDHIPKPAKQALKLAKTDIRKLITSKVNYFSSKIEKERRERHKKLLHNPNTIITNTNDDDEVELNDDGGNNDDDDDSDNDILTVETLYEMRMSADHNIEDDLDDNDIPLELRLPLQSADRNLQFSMTKWGLRCLRWLKTPYDSIVRVYGLIKGLQHQIWSKLGLTYTSPDDLPVYYYFEEYEDYPIISDHAQEHKYLKHKQSLTSNNYSYDANHLMCHHETLLSLKDRWDTLIYEFYNPETKKFDISKIPDLYDNIYYDSVHNRPFLQI